MSHQESIKRNKAVGQTVVDEMALIENALIKAFYPYLDQRVTPRWVNYCRVLVN